MEIEQLLVKNEPYFNLLLLQRFAPPPAIEAPPPVVREAVVAQSASAITPKNMHRGLETLDLHIEKLVDDATRLTVSEIVAIQMQALEQNMQAAIVHRQPYMVIIHGKGEGKLRQRVNEYLDKCKAVVEKKDSLTPKYGYGATEVWLKYN
ncbi:MAG: hypothetical protein EBX41_06155 [Chitinophagia bacterium]|nr:hypothetical protein [Chitinophagia bacterium]